MTEQAKYLGEEPVSGDSKHLGLTKREYFAGLAINGLIAAGKCYGDMAKVATDYADMLLEELVK